MDDYKVGSKLKFFNGIILTVVATDADSEFPFELAYPSGNTILMNRQQISEFERLS